MPSVIINEIDNTIVQQTPSTYNTTLILGASTYGPSNTPTLLSNMADLNIFGGPMEGTYSFETAKNILRLGYPVLFTRITNNEIDGDGRTGYAYTNLYGHRDMKDKSLTDYTMIETYSSSGSTPVDYGYKATSVGNPSTIIVDTNYDGDIIVSAVYSTAIPDGVTISSALFTTTSSGGTETDTQQVVLDQPSIMSDRTRIVWTISNGTSGYKAPGITSSSNAYGAFKLKAHYTDGSTDTELVEINFSGTEVEAAVKVNAKYTGSYGNNINVNLYRTPLATTDEEETKTNYQYSLKVLVGNSLVETFKVMQYKGTGYNRGPGYDSDPLDETFDRALGAALAEATKDSKYITIINDSTSGVSSDFHDPNNLKQIDQIVENPETHATSYKANIINLSSTEGTYDDAESVGQKLFEISEFYADNSTTSTVYTALEDKYTYDFRFVTTAGFCKISDSIDFNNTKLYEAIRKLCYTRGDAFGILDVEQDLELTATELNDYLPVTRYESVDDSYIAYYCPWCYGPSVDGTNKWLPPSYWFMQTMFTNVNNGGQIYNPPAGVKRMRVAGITDTSAQIGGVTLNELQDENASHIRINPIMNLRNYGYVVYGLRTAYALSPPYELSKKSALQQPHVRIIANEIKSVIFDTALGLTFDNNNLITWNAFTSKVSATLSSMQTNNALNDYEIIMDESLQTDDRKVIYGSVKISVFEAVEDFIIDFQLDPSTVVYGEATTATL